MCLCVKVDSYYCVLTHTHTHTCFPDGSPAPSRRRPVHTAKKAGFSQDPITSSAETELRLTSRSFFISSKMLLERMCCVFTLLVLHIYSLSLLRPEEKLEAHIVRINNKDTTTKQPVTCVVCGCGLSNVFSNPCEHGFFHLHARLHTSFIFKFVRSLYSLRTPTRGTNDRCC